MTIKNKKTVNSEKSVWLITGCSTGFGRELATQALARGFRTVVTARKPEQVEELAAKGEALVLKLDVTDQGQIDAAIKAAEEKFGGIDVLVNNAGIGYFAAIEEGEESEVRRMFEINVFGMSRMIQAVLPGMRKRRTRKNGRRVAQRNSRRFGQAARRSRARRASPHRCGGIAQTAAPSFVGQRCLRWSHGQARRIAQRFFWSGNDCTRSRFSKEKINQQTNEISAK